MTITVDYSQTPYYTISNPNSIAVSMTTFTYDKNGNFTSMTTPDGQVESYVYDDAGRLLTKTLANGTQITHTYDEAGNLLETRGTKTVDGVAQSIVLTTTYDDQGRVKEKQDETGTLRYAYDQDGKILAETRIENGKIISQNRYDYSVDGQQERYRLFVCDLTAPAYGAETDTVYDAYSSDVSLLRQDIAYYYDNQARVIRVVDRVSGSVTRYVYDSEGAIAEKIAAQLVNGVETTISRQAYTYNLAGLATEIRYFSQDATASYKVEALTYRRDGNRISKSSGNTVTTYEYDVIGRLTKEVETQDNVLIRCDSYVFDALGNRLRKDSVNNGITTRTEYCYNTGNMLVSETVHQLTDGAYVWKSTNSYTYDASGNMLSKTVSTTVEVGTDSVTNTYTYDALNRMNGATVTTTKSVAEWAELGLPDTVTDKTTTTTYSYDANGCRIGKALSVSTLQNGVMSTSVSALRHYNDGTSIVYDEVKKDSVVVRRFSYLFGSDMAEGYAQFEAMYNGTSLYVAVIDAHKDVVELIATDGTRVAYQYDAYGNEVAATETDVYNPYRYTSQYYDGETGLYFLRARYYDPSTGRFTQRDTYLGEENNPFTLNLYGYCGGNPVMLMDVSGNIWILLTVTAVAGGCLLFGGCSSSSPRGNTTKSTTKKTTTTTKNTITTSKNTTTTSKKTTTTSKKTTTTTSRSLPKITYCSQNPNSSSFKKADWKKASGGYYKYSAGCAVACTVMALSSLGKNYLPKDICKWNGNSVYMNWSAVKKNANVKYDKQGTGGNPPYGDSVLRTKIDNYRSNPSKYAPVIIWMENEGHYVVLTNRLSSGHYECLDPMNSSRKTIKPQMQQVNQYVQYYV